MGTEAGGKGSMSKRRTRVFHVDDNSDARTLLGFILQGEEDLDEVGSRSSAEGLLEEVRRTSPDVLLMDLTMEGGDPIEAIRAVRAAFSELRILVLSGCSDPEVLERARAAGASGHIVKPSSISETLNAIRGHALTGGMSRN